MAVLERSELDASSLADLHAIADQIGLDGFRRLRKAELIDAILNRSGAPQDGADETPAASEKLEPGTARRRRSLRTRRARSSTEIREGQGGAEEVREGQGSEEVSEESAGEPGERSERHEGRGARDRSAAPGRTARRAGSEPAAGQRTADRPARGQRTADRPARGEGREERVVEGVVELLGNGSAFLRVSPPEASDEDLYISAAQVRRCELVSGDRVSGPVRTPRQSERYPSLARVDTINGASAESVAEGTRYEDLAVAYPCERLELDSEEPTLKAIEWLTPIGRGSRVAIVGGARSGKTETLRRMLGALAGRSSSGREGLEVMLVLSGVRPEEIAVWREGPVAPAAAVDLAASADLQSQTVEHVVDTAKRVAARGGDVVVLIDSLDGLHPHVARRILAAARNLAEGGSLTAIATSTRPLGGESTVIALDVALTSTGRLPALDLAHSGTVRPELLVGEDGAEAITKARASAMAS